MTTPSPALPQQLRREQKLSSQLSYLQWKMDFNPLSTVGEGYDGRPLAWGYFLTQP